MANNPLGTQGLPANGNQNILANGNEDTSDQNFINDILRHLLLINFFDLQQQNAANNNFNATGQNPASSHPQASVSNACLASSLASMNWQVEQFRNTAIGDLWHNVPDTVDLQLLFQMRLIDANPRFIIPVQMALRFFPPPLAHSYEYLTVTGRDNRQWLMRYAYNSGTHNFEIISAWDTFLHHYSIRIGDYVSFLMNNGGDIFVTSLRGNPRA